MYDLLIALVKTSNWVFEFPPELAIQRISTRYVKIAGLTLDKSDTNEGRRLLIHLL